ncbi:MAG TPA: DNA-binding protein [Acidimicrobiaceae bacterium]|nr:DNA-binding protein [Acidimicrobiaceae bacterium]
MNKRELAKSVAVHSDVDLSTVSRVLEGFTDVVTAVVSKGEAVAISGFAKFVKVDRPARMGRNPATGEQIMIKASKKARITPVKAFKEAVLNPSNAPKLKRGSFPIMDDLVKAAGKAAAPARKAATATRAPAKKTAKKSTARKAPARKAPARRTAAKRPAAKKTTARKTTAKKTARRAPARRAPARKATRGRR